MRCLRLLVLALALAAAPQALAVQPHEIIADPAQEERARVLYKEYPVDHRGGIAVGLADGVGFLTARFAGEALPATCTG